MSVIPLSLDDLDDWLDGMAEVDGIDSATRDPEKLNTPGVLAQVLSLGADTLDGSSWRVDLRLVLVVGDKDVRRAQDALVKLLNPVRAYLGNLPVEATATTFRSAPGPDLPALAVPHTIRLVPDDDIA